MNIKRVLVANRGEIALRITRACHEEGIGAVAVYSAADAFAPFVRAADLAVPIGPAPPAPRYLRIETLAAAAGGSGADGRGRPLPPAPPAPPAAPGPAPPRSLSPPPPPPAPPPGTNTPGAPRRMREAGV